MSAIRCMWLVCAYASPTCSLSAPAVSAPNVQIPSAESCLQSVRIAQVSFCRQGEDCCFAIIHLALSLTGKFAVCFAASSAALRYHFQAVRDCTVAAGCCWLKSLYTCTFKSNINSSSSLHLDTCRVMSSVGVHI